MNYYRKEISTGFRNQVVILRARKALIAAAGIHSVTMVMLFACLAAPLCGMYA